MTIRRCAGRLPAWILSLAAASFCAPGVAAPEAQVKAAYIVHFIEFVQWPQRPAPDGRAPFVIGVIGEEPVDEALAGMVRGQLIGGQPIEIRRILRRSDAEACQIIYVSRDGEDLFRLSRLGDSPVLTVGETDGFLKDGGMIEFYNDGSHLKLRINLSAAHAASLEISAKLLRVAQVLSHP